MRISGAFRSAIALVRDPDDFIRQNKSFVVPLDSLIINYVAVLAAVPFIATLLGDLWYYYRFGGGFAIGLAIITYVLEVLGVIVMGIVIWKLSPYFESRTDQTRATIIAAYIYTPFFLLSIVDIVPYLGVITFLGLLYGVYILYLGLPILMDTPPKSVIPYVFAILVASVVIFAIVAGIIDAVTATRFFM